LGRTFPDRSSTLVYLYWEPLDAASYDEFRHHREELATLSAAVDGARVDVITQSFDTLWQNWLDQSGPDWVPAHVERLRNRYAVSLGTAN
ncbi:MAG: PGN_0703 family putative restriction endonuclease, partial [Geminicoccaceae bacterium]